MLLYKAVRVARGPARSELIIPLPGTFCAYHTRCAVQAWVCTISCVRSIAASEVRGYECVVVGRRRAIRGAMAVRVRALRVGIIWTDKSYIQAARPPAQWLRPVPPVKHSD